MPKGRAFQLRWRTKGCRAFGACAKCNTSLTHCDRALINSSARQNLPLRCEVSPPNQWTKLIEHGVTELGHELSDKKMPALDAVEWLAEWAQDTRSAQRGLLLLTAHRAKGLEFDDVVIIDSDWGRLSKDEDPDAPRRLFYVAMTRARRSLSIVTAGEQNFLDAGLHSTVRRHIIPDAKRRVGGSTQIPDA